MLHNHISLLLINYKDVTNCKIEVCHGFACINCAIALCAIEILRVADLHAITILSITANTLIQAQVGTCMTRHGYSYKYENS